MLFNWTISLGQVISMMSFIIVGSGIIYTMKGQIDSMSARLLVLEGEIKSLIGILVQQGRQEERLAAIDSRLATMGIRLDELARRFNERLDKL